MISSTAHPLLTQCLLPASHIAFILTENNNKIVRNSKPLMSENIQAIKCFSYTKNHLTFSGHQFQNRFLRGHHAWRWHHVSTFFGGGCWGIAFFTHLKILNKGKQLLNCLIDVFNMIFNVDPIFRELGFWRGMAQYWCFEILFWARSSVNKCVLCFIQIQVYI